MAGAAGTYGIVVQHLKTGEAYCANEHRVFNAGSLYKLWVMATVYFSNLKAPRVNPWRIHNQIQNGELQKDEVLNQSVATLNEEFYIDPDYAELSGGTVIFTVQEALTQMITISHNYAALLLMERVRLSSVAAFLRDNGFVESAVGTADEPPKTTPHDTALFFAKLYRGELANDRYTNEMLDLLKGQQLNEGLPRYLPDEAVVAHKTGEIDLYKHDAGIVFSDKGDYIIVVMSESDFPSGAQERIALVSKVVFDYF